MGCAGQPYSGTLPARAAGFGTGADIERGKGSTNACIVDQMVLLSKSYIFGTRRLPAYRYAVKRGGKLSGSIGMRTATRNTLNGCCVRCWCVTRKLNNVGSPMVALRSSSVITVVRDNEKCLKGSVAAY